MKFIQIGIILWLSLILGGLVNCMAISPDDLEVKKNQPLNLEIYLLIGQSNMAGRADIEIQDQDTLENVYLFTGISGKEWEKAANPLNKYSTVRKELSMQKLGPGYTFAREIAKARVGKQIGLVVNAKGVKAYPSSKNKSR